MNNEERGLALRNATLVTSDVFGESKAKRLTSLDLLKVMLILNLMIVLVKF